MEKMPNARFILQNKYQVFGEPASALALPCFLNNIGIKKGGIPENRKIIPLKDQEANLKYYYACLKKEKEKLMPFLKSIHSI